VTKDTTEGFHTDDDEA